MGNQMIINKRSKDAFIYDVLAPTGVKNGNVVVLGIRKTDGTFNVAANTTAGDLQMAIVADVQLSYEADKVQDDYVIEEGLPTRAYQPVIGFTVTVPVLNITATATITKDYKVVPDAGELAMECLATAVGTEALIFNIDELVTINGIAMAKIRCIKVN